MALSIARAAALTIAGCALAAAAWLPPEPTEPVRPRTWSRNPEQRLRWEARRTDRELSLAAETLVFLERRDSLASAFAGVPAGAVGVAAPDVPAAWASWLADQTDATRGSGRVLAAVFMDTTSWRARPVSQRRWASWPNSTAIAFGAEAAPFACLAIHDLRRMTGPIGERTLMGPDWFPARNPLAICRFFAAYGPPGPGVRAWLLGGGWQFGSAKGNGRRGAFVLDDGRTDVYPSLVNDGRYALAGCIGGAAAACRAWWLNADESVKPRAEWTRDWRAFAALEAPGAFVEGWWGDPFGGLLDDLAGEMGDERFRAFWTAAAPADSAFASAFGMDVGTWTRDWLERRFGPLPRRGPRGADYAAAVLFGGLLVAFATAAGRRRQVR